MTSGEKQLIMFKTTMALIVRAIAGVALFASYTVVTRLLEQDEAGKYFLMFTIVTVLGVVARQGLDGAVIRFTSAYESVGDWVCVNGVIKLALVRVFFFSVIITIAVWLFADRIAAEVFNKPTITPLLKLAALSVPFLSISYLLARAMMGLHDALSSIFFQNIGVPLLMVLIFLCGNLIGFESSAKSATVALLIANVVIFFTALFWWFRGKELWWGGEFEKKKLRNSATPLYTVALMMLMVNWGGHLCAAYWPSVSDYVQLSVAQRISQLVSVVLPVINLVVAPRFSALYQAGDISGIARIALFAVKVSTISAFPVVMIICLFPAWVLSFFGDGFNGAIGALIILMIGEFVNVITGSTGFLLAMTGHEKDSRNVALIAGPLTILLSVVLTPHFGLIGSACATSAGMVVLNLGACWMVYRRLGFNALAVWRRNQ